MEARKSREAWKQIEVDGSRRKSVEVDTEVDGSTWK